MQAKQTQSVVMKLGKAAFCEYAIYLGIPDLYPIKAATLYSVAYPNHLPSVCLAYQLCVLYILIVQILELNPVFPGSASSPGASTMMYYGGTAAYCS